MSANTANQPVARYWAANSNKETSINFTPDLISRYLIFDWLPHLPSIKASDFMGWPELLTETHSENNQDYLCLQSRLGQSERQWGGFLSWMIGVAAARHLLQSEGYQWVAPASAFYPEARATVAIGNWPKGHIPGTLHVDRHPNSQSRLRPDYLAIRRIKNRWQLALVEAKGTNSALDNMVTCPPEWHAQARNAEVWSRNRKIQISRHLVIATRSNPRAAKRSTRRFQIRAWNSEERTRPPDSATVRAIAVAQLYGLAVNLSLPELAEGIILGEQVRFRTLRATAQTPPFILPGSQDRKPEQTLERMQERIDAELREYGSSHREGLSQEPISVRVGSGVVEFQVEIEGQTASLMRRFASMDSVDDQELDGYSESLAERMGATAVLATSDERAMPPMFPGVVVSAERRALPQLGE